MTGYSTLIASKSTPSSLKSWVNNDTIPSETILSDAQTGIYSRLRNKNMYSTATGTITAGANTIDIPARYHYFAVFKYISPDDIVLRRRTSEFIHDMLQYSTATLETSVSLDFTVEGTRIILPYANDVNRVWQQITVGPLPPLSTATETNFLTEDYPRLLRAACLVEAYEWLENQDRKVYWNQIYEKELAIAMAEYHSEMHDLVNMPNYDR